MDSTTTSASVWIDTGIDLAVTYGNPYPKLDLHVVSGLASSAVAKAG